MTQNHAKDNNQMQASFATLLSRAAEALTNYLDRLLPSLFDNWWKDAVADKLSFQQQRRVEQKGIVSLSSLDLAALLRVLDQNWYQISTKMNLSSESRHFVKEMQTIRNRWAHAGTEEFPIDDVYRDIDTLQRFVTVIEAEEVFIKEIRAAKTSLLKKRLISIPNIPANEAQPSPRKETQAAEFAPGQIVFLKSNSEIKGAVLMTPNRQIISKTDENRSAIFFILFQLNFFSQE